MNFKNLFSNNETMTEKLIIRYFKNLFSNNDKIRKKAFSELMNIIPKSSKEKIFKDKLCTCKSLHDKIIVKSYEFSNCTYLLVYNFGLFTKKIKFNPKYEIFLIETERNSYDIYKPVIYKIL